MKQTLEVEHYHGLVMDDKDDSELVLPATASQEDASAKALTLGDNQEQQQLPDDTKYIENGDVSRVKRGKLVPKKSVSFDEFPEVIEDIPLEDIELPKSKKALQEKDVTAKSAKGSAGKTAEEAAPMECQDAEGEVQAVQESQRKLSRGRGSLSQDAEEGKRRGRRRPSSPKQGTKTCPAGCFFVS